MAKDALDPRASILTLDPTTCTHKQWQELKHYIHTTEKCVIACVDQRRYYQVERKHLKTYQAQSFLLEDIDKSDKLAEESEKVYRAQLQSLLGLKARVLDHVKARAERSPNKEWLGILAVVNASPKHKG